MGLLDDKKNQPYVIGVCVLVFLAVGVYMYMMLKPKQPQMAAAPTDVTNIPPPATDPNAVPPTTGVPPTGVTPGATGTGTAPVAAAPPPPAKPIEKARPDPFKPFWRPPPPKKERVIVREVIPYPTWLIIPRKKVNPTGEQIGEQADTTPRRMAGVMFGGTVSAILETGGETVIVKPGDLVENATMRVEKIEPNQILLKSTASGKPRYVVVKMSAGVGAAASAAPTGPIAPPTPGSPTPGSRPTPGSGPRSRWIGT